ncbi:20S-pre-rRNA D-site endonuclease nob1 [Purpureocillium lavendulum]|uniref:20S-pre-rRNA D-site endonuclease nob1 n=1 Tax=Purpureocillium lavendulum TaxID=1247861 RepID=A0AB34FM07_9HYPO|nr:20S-pre-rRNA D-site endonuclease nob1 [Purpureocillium lavendulum]
MLLTGYNAILVFLALLCGALASTPLDEIPPDFQNVIYSSKQEAEDYVDSWKGKHVKGVSGYAVGYVLGAVVAFEPKSLSEYIDEIPTCSLSGFAKGMREEGCDTSTIDSTDIGCLCKNAGRIAVVVSREVEAQCALDFGQAVGKACGVWIAWSVSASDLPRATSILGDKLKGKGGTAAKTSDVASSTTGVTGATGQPTMADGDVFAIIGGGIAGTIQAICLAKAYPRLQIHLFERNRDLLSGTSCMNPGRPTFGFHYQHLDTATFCQDNTVKFTKFLKSLGCQKVFARAPQKGIYVLVKDPVTILGQSVKPVFGPDEIIPVFDQIRSHAIRRYARDDVFVEHFGPPDQICREMDRSEYERFLTPELSNAAGACYETAEKTFDVPGICAFLRDHVSKYKNITVRTEAFVTRLVQVKDSKAMSYRIFWIDKGKNEYRHEVAQFLTLACWERVGLFKKQLGKDDGKPTHNRLKMLAIVDVKVPRERLDTIRPIFVASGPFSMISPQKLLSVDDQYAVCRCACTLAIRTNVMVAPDNEVLPKEYVRMLEGTTGRRDHESNMAAGAILEGARQFFACLGDASSSLADVRFGTVRVPFGAGHSVDLHDRASEHHARNYPGCYRLGSRLFVNEAMKMIYSVYNAEQIVDWVRADSGVDVEL